MMGPPLTPIKIHLLLFVNTYIQTTGSSSLPTNSCDANALVKFEYVPSCVYSNYQASGVDIVLRLFSNYQYMSKYVFNQIY